MKHHPYNSAVRFLELSLADKATIAKALASLEYAHDLAVDCEPGLTPVWGEDDLLSMLLDAEENDDPPAPVCHPRGDADTCPFTHEQEATRL